MCTLLLPPGGNPIAVNKYVISDVILKARDSQTVGVITRGFLNMLVSLNLNYASGIVVMRGI